MPNSYRRVQLFLVLATLICGGCGGNAAKPPATENNNPSMPAVSPPSSPPAPVIQSVPMPDVADLGPVPTPAKIDSLVQKRIMELGAKLKELSAKNALEAPITRLDFTKIGHALYNYEDLCGHYPALNGNGKKGDPHPGLSWRVMLLPYLDQTPLYLQFKLDEPWDSPHNKPLIGKMPTVFGKNADGKTRVHVLTGKGTLFKDDEGLNSRQANAGFGNTLLAVVAGPDTAEIWTKPGGLKFDPQQPLKCLGNIGDKFFTLAISGGVRQFPKTINPAIFSQFVQMGPGKKLNLDALNLLPFGISPTPKFGRSAPPSTPLIPATQRLDLSYVPDDAFAAVVIHPRRINEHSIIKRFGDMLTPEMLAPASYGASYQTSSIIIDVLNQLGAAGITVQSTDELTLLADKNLLQTAWSGEDAPSAGVILRNSNPINIDLLLTNLAENSQSMTVQEFEGMTLSVLEPEQAAIAFVTDSVMLVGRTDTVKKMISAREQTAATTALKRRIERVGNRMLVLAVDAAPFEASAEQFSGLLSGPAAPFSQYILGSKELSLTFDLDAAELLQAQLQFNNPELSTGLFRIIAAQIELGQQQLATWRQALADDSTTQGLVPYLDRFKDSAEFANLAGNLTFTIPRQKDLDKLLDLLKPTFDAAKRASDLRARENDMPQIGFAFMMYEKRFLRFPAPDGPGDKAAKHPGLSWRVELLPFINEAELYKQFRLDQPWDSPHNKALITKMPKLFGNSKDGKTSLHVITGQGTLFNNGEGLAMRDIKDGPQRTIVAVEVEDDLADFWTKPGGLKFDPKSPLKCLGKTKEFLAVTALGSPLHLKNIDPEVFSRLVQPADGKPVRLPPPPDFDIEGSKSEKSTKSTKSNGGFPGPKSKR